MVNKNSYSTFNISKSITNCIGYIINYVVKKHTANISVCLMHA
jgi:hypothetical protein